MTEKIKILVVDDEAVILDSAQKILSREGFGVRITNSAERALEILHADPPAIMLVDLKLPKLSGMELLKLVRGEFPALAVIIMTGYSTLENAVAALKNGAFDFLPKPFAFEELVSTLHRAVRSLALPIAARDNGANNAAPLRYRLGVQGWAKINEDGSAQLGVTDFFQQMVGPIMQAVLPAFNEGVQQGGRLAEILAADQMKHTAWSALSGRVVARNELVETHPELLNHDPLVNGWLLKIIPDRLENELANLIAER
ncbi:MAG: Glycine cleavage system H protein [bacterium]|nr:Glycine cleavage system H protein [bacterium]